MSKAILVLIPIFALISISFSHANETAMKILLKGRISKETKTISRVIDDDDQLSVLWKELGQKSVPPKLDFSKESVVFFVSQNSNAEEVILSKIEQSPDSKIDVIFISKEKEKSSNAGNLGPAFPYTVGRIPNTKSKKLDIVLKEQSNNTPIPSNQGLDEDFTYTNMLSQNFGLQMIEYVPLDVGNRWTYKIKSKNKNAKVTQEVQSVSNGWSILNSLFGKQNVAMKIEQSGQVLVSSGDGVRSFYNDTVQTMFIKESISTPAGKFTDLMIVTVEPNDNFWFRDVYAKGVGLVYHEHTTPNGRGEYTLVKAKVRGREFPG